MPRFFDSLDKRQHIVVNAQTEGMEDRNSEEQIERERRGGGGGGRVSKEMERLEEIERGGLEGRENN